MSINLGGAVLPSCFVIHLACTIPNAPQNWTFYCVLLHPFQAHASPLKKPYSRKIIKQRYPVHPGPILEEKCVRLSDAAA